MVKRDIEKIEKKAREMAKRGICMREELEELIVYLFYDMQLEKMGEILSLYYDVCVPVSPRISLARLAMDLMLMKPIREEALLHPMERVEYSFYYSGDTLKALEMLKEHEKEILKDYSLETLLGIYFIIYNVLGKFVIPPVKTPRMDTTFVALNRFSCGDIMYASEKWRPEMLPVDFHASKRMALMFRLLKSIMVGDSLTFEAILRTFQSSGERYMYTYSKILGQILSDRYRVESEDIPPYVRPLRVLNDYVRGRIKEMPEGLKGLESMVWHLKKSSSGSQFLSFAGKLRLVRGADEVRLPRRKAVAILGIMRVMGKDYLMGMAERLFPNSPNPVKTVRDYMRFVKDYRHVPTNLNYTLNSGIFLYDEKEEWASILKSDLRRMGRLKEPVYVLRDVQMGC